MEESESKVGLTPRRALFGIAGLLLVVALVRLGRYLERAPIARFEAASNLDRATLVFVFQSGDCPTYRGLVERWNRLDRRETVDVIGVGLDLPEDSSERAALLGRSGVEFPVRTGLAEPAEDLMLRMGFTRTPFSVLLDPRGRARLTLPPTPDSVAQDVFDRQVRRYARTLETGNSLSAGATDGS